VDKNNKGQEGAKMLETIQNEWILQGFKDGRMEGELKGKVSATLLILRKKFGQVPQHIVESLNTRTDVIAMESLVVQAAMCSSLDEFEAAL
jgi:hypothetical protein